MSHGNGIDLGAVYTLLTRVAEAVTRHDQQFAGIARDVSVMKRQIDDMSTKVDGMRQALTEYHASVLGHGILITQLDDRVRRIEHHLGLPPAA
jgi:hypothetical protein